MPLPSTTELISDCQFCSVVSQANGEDPIGTAGTHAHWLIMELPLPWTGKLFEEPVIKPVMELMRTLILQHQIKLRPLAIAPDAEYSQPGYARILYYSRTPGAFAQFDKQEFLVPTADATRCATALLHNIINQPNQLENFHQYQINSYDTRELLVCTHGNVDVACARFGYPIYKELRTDYADSKSLPQLRVWRCSHFGGHQFAPTLIDLPTGHYWGRLEPHLLEALVTRSGDLTQLRSCYRGWSGLSKFEQIAEREIWMQQGWDWLNYHKSGQTIAIDQGRWYRVRQLLRLIPSKRLRFILDHRSPGAKWAVVQIDFASPDGTIAGHYTARIEEHGQVMTAFRSGTQVKLQPVKQYRVTQFDKS